MIFLILAIISSSLVSIVMRISEKYIHYNCGLLTMNYVMCFSLAFLTSGQMQIKTDTFTIGLGLFSGFLYLFSFFLLQFNINKNGVILSSTFMKLGVLVPTFLSMVFFHEKGTINQFLGLFFAIVSILIMNLRKDEHEHSYVHLIILLLVGGFTDFIVKIYEQLGSAQYQETFLFLNFLFAFFFSLVLLWYKKQKIGKEEVFFGLILGIPNYFSSKFLLYALKSIPAIIAYPTYSVAVILTIGCFGLVLFKEKLNIKQWIGFIFIIVSIVLLNI